MTDTTTRITGSDNDTGTRSANDQGFATHTTATLPNSYPPQPLAPVRVVWGLIVKANSPATAVMTTVTDSIHLDTTLTDYVIDVPTKALSVYNLWSQFTSPPISGDVEIHWSIDIDNVTAPPYAAGAYPMKKQHLDGHLSYMNVAYDAPTGTVLNTSAQSIAAIKDPIMKNIPFMQQIAKY